MARTRLNRGMVLAAAFELLDEQGLDGLTMRNLSDRLGVVPMALYRHVANKDDLVDAVLDYAVTLVELPPADLAWPDALAGLARAIRAVLLTHPSIAGAVIGRPSLGPGSLVLGEYGLGALRRAGFSDDQAQRGLNLVLTYTLGFAALEVPRLGVMKALDREVSAAYDTLPADEFPHTVAVRPRFGELVSDEQFEFGLHTVVAGLAALLPPRPRPRPASR